MRAPSILEAMTDPHLFGPWFVAPSWDAWRVALKAVFGLPLTGSELELFQRATGRTTPPPTPVREAWFIVGRRGGKSLIAALTAVYLACFRDWRPHLGPGERATIMVIAADRRQARVAFRYVRGLLEVPLLRRLVEAETAEAIHLASRVSLEIHTASYRAVRGYTVAAVIADEVAFWRAEDSANPDREILAALRPGLATLPGALLLAISTPHARRGEVWRAFREHWGRDGSPVLVWQAPTRTMNPTLSAAVLERARAEDPVAARAEFEAEFRSDLEAFVPLEVVEAAVAAGVGRRPPLPGVAYRAFVDPSGGRHDSMTLAVAHPEPEGRVILDAVLERRPPFSPEAVVREFAAECRAYGVREVVGDRYGGAWPQEAFARAGLAYRIAEAPKSELYRQLLPLLTSGRVELLDHQGLLTQLTALERRVGGGGREIIDHAPGATDDLANAAAGALVLAAGGDGPRIFRLDLTDAPEPADVPAALWRRAEAWRPWGVR